MAAAFANVRLARLMSDLPWDVTVLAAVALLVGLVLRIAGVLVVTLTAVFGRFAEAVNARFDNRLFRLLLALVVGVFRLASLALVWLIRGTDAATATVLARGVVVGGVV